MKASVAVLTQLSDIDKTIHQLRTDKKEIPGQVQDIKEDVIAMKTDLKNAQEALTQAQDAQKLAKEFIQEKLQWAASREANINNLKTNKEFQAVTKEVSLARKEIKDKEEELKTIEEQIIEAQTTLDELSTEHNPRIEELVGELHKLKDHFDGIGSKLNELATQKESITKQIPDARILSYYKRVSEKVAPAISQLVDEKCLECGQKIMPQEQQKIKKGEALTTCTGCKRILYIEEYLNA